MNRFSKRWWLMGFVWWGLFWFRFRSHFGIMVVIIFCTCVIFSICSCALQAHPTGSSFIAQASLTWARTSLRFIPPAILTWRPPVFFNRCCENESKLMRKLRLNGNDKWTGSRVCRWVLQKWNKADQKVQTEPWWIMAWPNSLQWFWINGKEDDVHTPSSVF